MAWWLVAFATIRLSPLFLSELLPALDHLGKFLVYDAYTRLFPMQFYDLVIIKLIHRGSICKLGPGAYRFLYYLQSRHCHDRDTLLDRYFKRFFDPDDVSSIWIDIIESCLGYYSYNLFMRVKPFREEVIKELFCAVPFLPESSKKFIKTYSGEKLIAASREPEAGL
jgi:hypothetical protein